MIIKASSEHRYQVTSEHRYQVTYFSLYLHNCGRCRKMCKMVLFQHLCKSLVALSCMTASVISSCTWKAQYEVICYFVFYLDYKWKATLNCWQNSFFRPELYNDSFVKSFPLREQVQHYFSVLVCCHENNLILQEMFINESYPCDYTQRCYLNILIYEMILTYMSTFFVCLKLFKDSSYGFIPLTHQNWLCLLFFSVTNIYF